MTSQHEELRDIKDQDQVDFRTEIDYVLQIAARDRGGCRTRDLGTQA